MGEEIQTVISLSDSKKLKVSYSVDEKTLKEFDKICNSKGLKKSRVIENLIKVFLDNEKSLFGNRLA